MPRIYLCFMWHMHQPFYKDLVTGEYRLPWTRMHALKDYYGMARILEEFPGIRQTFNLVPSMIVQVEEYASGSAVDPFLVLALKPAETLTAADQSFILRNFFMANAERLIYRYPRYGELRGLAQAGAQFSAQDFRDLQVLSQVAWFDEEFQEHDPEVRGLIEKGRNFSDGDQALMGRKQREICAKVIPQYRKLAAAGQIEISTTPFYHPILPLLCDSDIAAISHPHVPLPPRFSYPGDAELQLQMSRDYIETMFGVAPAGLWPSEGSVSDQALQIASSVGFGWAATDNGVLERTLRRPATAEVTYRPYVWKQDGREMKMIFRDHVLSDLIGFVYSGMGAREAAHDFLHRIQENCRGLLAAGRDALVPIILDGENAWEYYDHNGRPFFRELYSRIEADSGMEAITVSEAFERVPAETLNNIFPGSWINANFDVWIGAEEDNKSWRLLLDTRKAFDEAMQDESISEENRKLAREELSIAEGSDWNWWYGPEHDSENRVEFDQIYRAHLSNAYRAMGRRPPAELSQSILKGQTEHFSTAPEGPLSPSINGVIDSYFEWMGAGVYRVDPRSGSMHGKKTVVKEVRYGSDGARAFVRVDFLDGAGTLNALEVHSEISSLAGEELATAVIRIEGGRVTSIHGGAEAAMRDVLEFAVPRSGESRIRLSLWQDGLPVEIIPASGFLEITNEKPAGWRG